MDQHAVDFISVDSTRQGFQSGEFRTMPNVSSGQDPAQFAELRFQGFTRPHILSPSHQHDLGDAGDRLQQTERPVQDRPAGHLEEHFVPGQLHAGALTTGNDYSRRPHPESWTRTRRPAARQKASMLLMPSSRPVTVSRARSSASCAKSQGPRASTSVSLGTVRRTIPFTTSLHVSLIVIATTLTAASLRKPPPCPPPKAEGNSGSVEMTNRFAPGFSVTALRRRATIPTPGSIVRTTTSASAAAALNPP